MPYLTQTKTPYKIKGKSWTGIAAEYHGIFPDQDFESHYLVLCILTEKVAISLNITGPEQAFKKNEAFYRWLIENQLDIYNVKHRS